MSNANRTGNLSIDSDNIFPIIKKWLYSDHDIFARELISNGCDAITKLKKLDVMGEYTLPDDYKAKIQVIVNPEEKTLKFIDNGLGMTADEVEEYITQIAFSGATDFIEKYKDNANGDEIIGHFGLGFYSSFMVADRVDIITRSWRDGSKAVKWSCDGSPAYEIDEAERESRGSDIVLHISDDCKEFLEKHRDYILGLIDQIDKCIDQNGNDAMGAHFLDWPSSPNSEGVDAGYHALLVWAMQDAAKMSTLLGDEAHAQKCRDVEARLRKKAVNPNGLKQAAALMAIAGIMKPDQACRDYVAVGGPKGFSTFYGYS